MLFLNECSIKKAVLFDKTAYKRTKRAAANTLYVEFLVVTEPDVIWKMKAGLNSNDNDLAMAHMKIFFSHVMNRVIY